MLANLKKIVNSNDLKGSFARGGIILTGGTVFENLARLGRNMILARLLAPEYFGLMATVMAAVSLFEAFTDVGVKQSIIQNKDGSSADFLNIAWWFSCLRGLCLFFIAFLIAPLFCQFYSKPELSLPLRVAFLTLFLHGITSPRIYVLEKEFKYLKLTFIRQGAAILNVSVAVSCTFFYKNIWPLILGYLTEYFSVCLLSYIFCTFIPRLSIHRLHLQELLKFARGMVGLPILTAVFLQLDVFAIGKLLSMDQLGFYYLARNLAAIPLFAFTKIVRPLLLPAFSKMQDNLELMGKSLIKIETLIAALSSPFIAFCVIFAETILGILYGWQYAVASLPFSILIITALVRFYSGVLMQIFFAVAKPNIHRTFALVRLGSALIIIYPAIELLGMTGASLTIFLSMISLFGLQLIWTSKKLNIKVSAQLFSISKGFLFSAFVVIPGLLLKTVYPDKFLVIICGGVTLLLISWILAIRNYFGGKSPVI